VDRPLTVTEQAEVREFSTRARITATSFHNGYHWGDFRGDPGDLMRRYYDAHLYLANWGTHRIMLRLPRTLLDPEIARQYSVDDQVTVTVTDEHVIIDMVSQDEEGEWEEETEDSLSAIIGVRAELAAGDLRPLYLAWLSAYGVWERDEDTFDSEDEDNTGAAGARGPASADRGAARPRRLPAPGSRSAGGRGRGQSAPACWPG
jgi:hypothetical protein